MCYEDGELLSYLDGECPADERGIIEGHAAECATCASSLARLSAERDVATGALDVLMAVTPVEAPGPVAVSSAAPERRAVQVLWRRLAIAAAALLFLGSFALAPVRSLAADILRVFRIERVQTLSLTQDDIQRISETLAKGEGKIDLEKMGELDLSGGQPEPKEVTLAEAADALNFPVVLPPGIDGTPTLALQPAMTIRFNLHVDAVNEALRYYGSEKMLPREVDGKEFTVKIPAVLTAGYGPMGGGAVEATATFGNDPSDPDDQMPVEDQGFVVGQARSPELILPDGVDPLAIRDVLINLPFLPQNVRDQLASINDWHNTLIIPSFGGSSREIMIDGVPAVVVTTPASDAPAPDGSGVVSEFTGVMWQADGVVRGVAGPGDEARLTGIAKTMIK